MAKSRTQTLVCASTAKTTLSCVVITGTGPGQLGVEFRSAAAPMEAEDNGDRMARVRHEPA